MFDFDRQVQCGDIMCQYLDPEKLKGIDEQLDDFDTQLQAEDVYTEDCTNTYAVDENGNVINRNGEFIYLNKFVQLRSDDNENSFQDCIIRGCCDATVWLLNLYEEAEFAEPIQFSQIKNGVISLERSH